MTPTGSLLAVTAIAWSTGAAVAQVKMTTKQALALAFPQCKIERQTHVLSAAKRRRIAKETGQKFTRATAFAYVARKAGKIVGTGWFDVHRVRSKKQLLLVTVTPEQTVGRVEVLAFGEPRRYRAPQPWLRRFAGKRSGGMQLGKGVQRITGATLTVQATTRCVERVLAVHRVVFGPVAKKTTAVGAKAAKKRSSKPPAAKTGKGNPPRSRPRSSSDLRVPPTANSTR